TSDERLWYRDTDAEGAHFVIFDPVKLTKEPAFDHAKLAAALSAAAGQTYEATNCRSVRSNSRRTGNRFHSASAGAGSSATAKAPGARRRALRRRRRAGRAGVAARATRRFHR